MIKSRSSNKGKSIQKNTEIDDPSIGPPFEREHQYTYEQLKCFSKQIARHRFKLTELSAKSKNENKELIKRSQKVLFDDQLNQAQILIQTSKPSKMLLLRTLQRFLDCTEKYQIEMGHETWFFLEPQTTSNVTSLLPHDPSKPSTSTGRQRE
jgi:hypothetical protein